MSNLDIEETFGGVFDSFSSLVNSTNVALTPKDSTQVNLDKLINDNIYGLLSLPELSPQQVALLAALLSGRD